MLQTAIEWAEGDDTRIIGAKQRHARLAHHPQRPRGREVVLIDVAGVDPEQIAGSPSWADRRLTHRESSRPRRPAAVVPFASKTAALSQEYGIVSAT